MNIKSTTPSTDSDRETLRKRVKTTHNMLSPSGKPRTDIDLDIEKLTVLYKTTANPRMLHRTTSHDAVFPDGVIGN